MLSAIASRLSGRERTLFDFALTLGVFAGALVVMLLLRHGLFRALYKRAGTKAKSVFLDALKFPSFLWALAAALEIALRYAKLTERQVSLAETWIVIFVIASLSIAAAAGAVRMFAAFGERQAIPFAVVGLSRTLIYVVVLTLGALVLLSYLNIRITPLLTALGVGGLAVALALQDTLANFFAGIHILVETPIKAGDYIQLEGGQEGLVTDIGWRTTRVVTLGNNTVVVPNTKITSTVLTNFSVPSSRVSAEAILVADLSADIERVQQVAIEEAAAAEGVLSEFPPLFLFEPGATPTHLQFKVIVQVAAPQDRGLVASRIRLRITERFRREGIPRPSPEKIAIVPQSPYADRR